MNALSKCNRVTLILGLCLILAGPAMLLWASRPQQIGSAASSDPDARFDAIEMERISRLQPPPPTSRPEAFSPFGKAFKDGPILASADAPGYLRLNIGDLDPKNPEALLSALPAELRLGDKEKLGLGAKGTLAPGLNYAMLSAEAVSAKSLETVMAGLRGDARIVGYGPNATLLLYVEASQIGRLRQNPDVAFFHAMLPGEKISLDTGRKPLLQKSRATDPNLLLVVALVPGSNAAAVREAVARVPGVVEITDSASEGSILLVRAEYRSLGRLARVPEIYSLQENLEMMTLNAKNVPSIQVGSGQESNFARPFDDIGVDGGGIDTNNDGQRINNGSDVVPPQIVGVLDNGISADTPSFSQTATQVTDLTHPIGASHRKIHAIINTPSGDGGADCDSTLHGAGSHGNVVASTIAAWPSGLGVFATRSGVGGNGQPRNVNLDGVARGSRVIVTDIANSSRCTLNSVVERGGNVDPGILATRLAELIAAGGTGVHLAVMPFGVPNFDTDQFHELTDGTYPQEAVDVDTFLYNNRDFLVFGPAGNNGVLISSSRPTFWTPRVIPDFFDGTNKDDDPNSPLGVQIAPPSTAKNIVTVGLTRADEATLFAEFDNMGNMATFSSRGPATEKSLRMAPIVDAPGSDLGPGAFEFSEFTAFRSKDDNNLDNGPGVPLDREVDEANYGTSYASAAATGAAALIRDYFAQGMYPTGERTTANRVPNVSGALVKASLVASARFTTNIRTPGETARTTNDKILRRTRATDLGTINGDDIGIIGNSEQGYGRIVLTNVLPLPNWSKFFHIGATGATGNRFTAGNTPPGPSHWEYPAQGLLAWDDIATAEPALNIENTECTGAGTPNACCTGAGTGTCIISKTHTFRVATANTIGAAGAGLAASIGQLRVGLAWTDPPPMPPGGGELVNDLDLMLEGPGPDNCLFAGDTRPDGTACPAGSDTDNEFRDGNSYPGTRNPFNDQWSKLRVVGQTEIHDKRNPQEGIHLSFDPNNDTLPADSQIYLGTYRVTVKRGAGGAIAGHITITGPNEDANNNRRLDSGEDTNTNGLLDLGGQTYALVVAGPVYLAEAAPSKGPSQFPQSSISLDKVLYSCDDTAVATIFDSTAGAGASRSTASTTFSVRNAAGATVDSETGIGFTAPASPAGATNSSAVPMRQGIPNPNDGILEVGTGLRVVATYAPAGQAPAVASGKVDCSPNFVTGSFLIQNNNAFGPQVLVGGGCDNDDNLDAGEVVTYGVAIANRGRNLSSSPTTSQSSDFFDVFATLTATGPGAGAITVLDSPKNIGRMPQGQVQGAYFHVKVDATAANALTIPNRVVTMTLSLDSLNKGRRVSTQSYSFRHAINADRETLRYSTDFPNGGRGVRDLNRNLVVDRPDILDPVRLFFLPDEDVTFSSMFVPYTVQGGGGLVTNTLGEDLNNNLALDATELDIIPNNGVLDRGILFSSTGPTPTATGDKVPWSFDLNNGGWVATRHPSSNATGVNQNVSWEYKTGGLCGFQTSGGLNKFGIWHTGDGDVNTPGPSATACDNYVIPFNSNTQPRVEELLDVLQSAIVAKVHQAPDSQGFPFTVEFQRLAMNLNDEIFEGGYAGMGINVDNDLDTDSTNSFFGQEVDSYYLRYGGWPYRLFNMVYQDFGYYGIYPGSTFPHQRTFGPFNDPNGGTPFDGGGETGFSASISVPTRTSPIPLAEPDYQKFPSPGSPVPGVCTGGTNPGGPCQTNPDCGSGGTCTLEPITIAGPVRNFETTLVGYEGGFASETLVGLSAPESTGAFNPGPAGNRWGIALGYAAIEAASCGVAGPCSTDYGFGVDDVVFEWDEFHPLDESAFSPAHTPACNRFGSPGSPAGGQCATITVDRTNLYECEEAVEITVDDPKLAGAPPASVQVMIVTDSDADTFSTSRFTVLKPNAKRYTLPAVAGQAGLFRGNVTFSGTSDTPHNVYARAGTDQTFIVYYLDPGCDGDGDGQAGEDLFDNLDGDGVNPPPLGPDNCPLIYNPGQADADGDGLGDLCDNCVNVANPGQEDNNADGVGNACELDDVDGDGVDNTVDDCPDLYNRDQAGTCTPGTRLTCQTDADCGGGKTCDKTRGHGFACSSSTQNLDGDSFNDNSDNCVLAANNLQTDTDHDGLGDACDPDCVGVGVVKICSTAPLVICNSNTDCPGTNPVCQTAARHGAGACSTVDDDIDVDQVEDAVDDCPGIYNPTIIPGTKHQLDTDRDGLGDVCDPAGSLDDDFNGVPDDLVTFAGNVACQQVQLGRFLILQTKYKDIDGDHDSFPDTGETGLVTVQIRNTGAALTGASFILQSTDPNVDCITFPKITVGTVAAGATVQLGSDTPLQAGSSFTFRASNALTSATRTSKINLCVTVLANEVQGGTNCFNLLADVDNPASPPILIAGPDGIPGTTDDGTLRETFDQDRAICVGGPKDGLTCISDAACGHGTCSGGICVGGPTPGLTCSSDAACGGPTCSGGNCTGGPTPGLTCSSDAACGSGGTCTGLDSKFTTGDIFKLHDAGTNENTHATFWHGSATGVGTNVIAGVACGGYATTAEGNPACTLDPDFPMDWHFHCPPTATNCPNSESGGFGAAGPSCVGGCTYQTPADGKKALTAPNSLHMGAHFDTTSFAVGDTTHLRTIQAFVSNPINLTFLSSSALSFFHIVDLVDGQAVSGGVNLCHDCALVQVQSDRNLDAAVDDWGPWDDLVPFQNVYDEKIRAWSTFGAQYCENTPTDTGTAPPAPRGVHETMCWGELAWGHCGSAAGTGATDTFRCTGGTVDPSGTGVWVQSKFNLGELLGQRIRIRWIAQTWSLDNVSSSYFERGPGWGDTPHDDGWWLDNIEVTGVLTTQATPPPDLRPAPATACPATEADNCNENASATDKGTLPQIKLTDAKGNAFGAGQIPFSGQSIVVTATDSTIPGGCVDGGAQFQFSRNGLVVQDWNSKAFYADTPAVFASYSVLVRCSSDTSCTSLTGASVNVPVFTASDGGLMFGTAASAFNASAGITYAAGTTTLNLVGGQPNAVDIYRGLGAIGPGTGSWATVAGSSVTLTPATCWLPNQAAVIAGGIFTTTVVANQVLDLNPGVGTATFYVANDPPPNFAGADVGCANSGRCLASPTVACLMDAECGGGLGSCENVSQLGPIPGLPPVTGLPPLACVRFASGLIFPPATAFCNTVGSLPAAVYVNEGAACGPAGDPGRCTRSLIPFPAGFPPSPLLPYGPGCPSADTQPLYTVGRQVPAAAATACQ